jgi:hypothetical protein
MPRIRGDEVTFGGGSISDKTLAALTVEVANLAGGLASAIEVIHRLTEKVAHLEKEIKTSNGKVAAPATARKKRP